MSAVMASEKKKETKEERARRLASQRARGRRYRERHPERHKVAMKKWRDLHPGYDAAWRRAYRKKHPDEDKIRSKSVLGRSCKFCGLSDNDRIFRTTHQCAACSNRKWKNGACGRCGVPFFRNQRTGRLYCKNCDENKTEAARVRAKFTPEQEALAAVHAGKTILYAWELLRATDGHNITKADFEPLCPSRGALDVTWQRVHTFITDKCPKGLGAYGVSLDAGGNSRGVLTINRRKLVAFLEPLVLYFSWREIQNPKARAKDE